MHKTNYLIELGHMCKHGERFAAFKNCFVLLSIGLVCEWVYIVFLSEFPNQPAPT